jgi:NTP pyrophosphatase (non-canonical NTP hydrolase)
VENGKSFVSLAHHRKEKDAMEQTWRARSEELHLRFVKHAQSLGRLTSEDEIVHFLALAIAGEAGELANLVKKKWQGDAVDNHSVREEIADISIYLEHLARHLHIDIDAACQEKLAVVADRLRQREQAPK